MPRLCKCRKKINSEELAKSCFQFDLNCCQHCCCFSTKCCTCKFLIKSFMFWKLFQVLMLLVLTAIEAPYTDVSLLWAIDWFV